MVTFIKGVSRDMCSWCFNNWGRTRISTILRFLAHLLHHPLRIVGSQCFFLQSIENQVVPAKCLWYRSMFKTFSEKKDLVDVSSSQVFSLSSSTVRNIIRRRTITCSKSPTNHSRLLPQTGHLPRPPHPAGRKWGQIISHQNCHQRI